VEIIGKLSPDILNSEFDELQTYEVVLTDERAVHK
jgi:hypothetical protein